MTGTESGYNIIAFGNFDKKNIKISFQTQEIKRSNESKQFIQKLWKKQKKIHQDLFPGNLIHVMQYNCSKNSINIETKQTTYDDYLASKNKQFRNQFPNEDPSNPLSVGALIITKDDKLVMGQRSPKLSTQPGKITVVAGMVDEKDIIGNRIDVFQAIKREIVEELLIKESDINKIKCLGLVYNNIGEQTYVPFLVKLNIDSKYFEAEVPSNYEFVSFFTIAPTKKNMSKLLRSNLSDIALPTLIIFTKTSSHLIKNNFKSMKL